MPMADGTADRAAARPAQRRPGDAATQTRTQPWLTARSNTAGADGRQQHAKNDRDAPRSDGRLADSEDKKPEKKEGGEGNLNIRIRDQTGEETFFKVKKTTKLDKVFMAVLDARKGVAATSLRFLFDGSRVRGDQTPADIDMEDGDQLDCACSSSRGASERGVLEKLSRGLRA